MDQKTTKKGKKLSKAQCSCGAPELLLPAGDPEKLEFALKYGADAVYMGVAPFSMRSRFNNFTEGTFLEAVRKIRKAGKIFYATVNIMPRNNKIEAFKKHLKFLRDKAKPDALIIADVGVIQLAKEICPGIPLHLSVQANALNYKSVEFWRDQGVKRVILPRELMLEEIAEIHRRVPDVELEAFVHGAICVAYSGRCLLSAYMTGRDANQGICAHSCRWKYKVREGLPCAEVSCAGSAGSAGAGSAGSAGAGSAGSAGAGSAGSADAGSAGSADAGEFFLEEEKRPGEFMPIEEDEQGTYIMNSKDNCLIEYLGALRDAGVCSFKIEGRNKTEYYLSIVAKAYRKAIDDLVAGREFDPSSLEELYKVANRGYIPGFLKGFPGKDNVHFESNVPGTRCRFIGIVREAGALGRDDLYRIEVRNRVEVGDRVEVVVPPDAGDGAGAGTEVVENLQVQITEMITLDGENVDVAHGGDKDVYFRLGEGVPVMGLLRVCD